MWIETAQQQGGNVGLNGLVLTAPVCQRCTVLAQGGLCHTNELSVTSSTPTPARPRTNTSPKWASVCGKFQRFSRYMQADCRESVCLVSLRNASSSPPQWGISLAEDIQGTWIIAVQLLQECQVAGWGWTRPRQVACDGMDESDCTF